MGWKAMDAPPEASPVTSVFGRTGTVVAVAGDYTAAKVTNAADKSSASTQSFAGGITVAAGKVLTSDGLTNATELDFKIGAATPFYVTASRAHASGSLSFDATMSGISANPITSGSLPTITPSTTVGLQVSTGRDVFLIQSCVFNPTAGAAATCIVALSPDNVTYSNLITVTYPAGIVFDLAIPPIGLQVPAGWYVKFTVANATLGTGTYY